VSDIQHESDQAVDAPEGAGDRERREARERAYQDVSLRAVELLAKAQRAADEAVAEAQAYARDLEETAREQYRHILQRAHEAARDVAGDGAGTPGEDGAAAPADAAALAAAASSGAVDSQELEYVRTYARVAHTQLKAVLGALNDELDRLADLADGRVEQTDTESPAAPEAHGEPESEPEPEPADEREFGHG
jgi:cell division septum initiation protein DivIVA